MTVRIPARIIWGTVLLLGLAAGAFGIAFIEDQVFPQHSDTSLLEARIGSLESEVSTIDSLTSRITSLERASTSTTEVSRSELCTVASTADGAAVLLFASQGKFYLDPDGAKTYLRGLNALSAETLNC